ncbi:HAD-IB family hydrolase [Desulforhopalus vacuolatus]|uniref:HAD-IB family hydrolase n=1 Tax=Desulforhopalus vacuolatus TaxID=40414 RepID=UPI001964BCB5|nr:HAD-IB family hydrolase [Desulforhopalus vacuolatus]MBM9518262.1 HAD-IB family hydrolase [Desulforhopalus vacuolatus]
MEQPARPLALFDFDGTLTSRDSFALFLIKTRPLRFYLAGIRFLPQILLFFVRRYPNQNLKERFLNFLLAGMHKDELKNRAATFVKEEIPAIMRPQAEVTIKKLLADKTRVVVVTASPRLLVEPWCRKMGIEILGTELDFADSIFTGRIDGLNCRGEEKVRRINKLLDLKRYAPIDVYGDSSGDLAMLDLTSTSHQHFKPFRD